MPIAPSLLATIEKRHAEVLGGGPRLAPLDRDLVADEVKAVTLALMRGISAPGEAPATIPLAAIPEIMFTLCRYPNLWQSLIEVTLQIQGPESALPERDRKLAILRTGWLCQAPYEFGEHVAQARRMGFVEEDIDRIVIGSTAPGWNEHEAAILAAAEELHANAMVSDATWTKLAEKLSDKQLFELLVVVGQFTATAYFQNSLRLRLEAANAGLASR